MPAPEKYSLESLKKDREWLEAFLKTKIQSKFLHGEVKLVFVAGKIKQVLLTQSFIPEKTDID